MTNRERFLKALNFNMDIDRIPAIEWTPLWGETEQRWRNDGLPEHIPYEAIKSYFGIDDIHTGPLVWPHGNNYPDLQYGHGLINNMKDYEEKIVYMYPENIVKDNASIFQEAAELQKSGDKVVGIVLYGFFWWPRELFGMENFLYAVYDYPDVIHRINRDLLKYNCERVEEIFDIVKPDYFVISEDMCGKQGPLISYKHFSEFMLPYYRELVPKLKKYDSLVLMDTDGQFEPMIPWIIEAGLDGAAPCERNAGVDPVRIRENYPDFLMIGGFDKTIMHMGEERIRCEFEHLLPVMRGGGFIPSCDHQVPPSVSLDDYKLYVKLLHEYCRKAVE